IALQCEAANHARVKLALRLVGAIGAEEADDRRPLDGLSALYMGSHVPLSGQLGDGVGQGRRHGRVWSNHAVQAIIDRARGEKDEVVKGAALQKVEQT